MDQAARTSHLGRFRAKKTSILVVTDVAARGIDIPQLSNVVNFDFPAKPKLFVHRVGRTARQGQQGTAYSLVANDELGYMLDLLLFLGRKPLNRCPDPAQAASGVWYGALPRRQLEEECDSARSIVAQAHDLQALQRSAANAFKRYQNTRSAASKASAGRSKLLPELPAVHPWLLDQVGGGDEQWAAMIGAVRGYQPKSTILELKQDSTAFNSMKRKRRTDQAAVASKRRAVVEPTDEAEPEPLDQPDELREHKWKDKDYFIEYEPADRDRAADFGFEIGGAHAQVADREPLQFCVVEAVAVQMEANVLELSGDTEAGLQRAKQVRKWDAKKKRWAAGQGG